MTLKAYNPTAPDAILSALTDIFAYLYNNTDTNPLIKAALVHYQFEMIHSFERYNGIVGRIVIPMILHDIIREALPLICLSEYWYYSKNEYFDLIRTTQYSGGYIRWTKFFVYAVGQTANRAAEILYEYLKRCPTLSIPYATKCLGLSFNSILKSLSTLQEHNIVVQNGDNNRNRV